MSPTAEPLSCSFCGKSQHDVRSLIEGPAVFICDECVAFCAQINADTIGNDRAPLRPTGPV